MTNPPPPGFSATAHWLAERKRIQDSLRAQIAELKRLQAENEALRTAVMRAAEQICDGHPTDTIVAQLLAALEKVKP